MLKLVSCVRVCAIFLYAAEMKVIFHSGWFCERGGGGGPLAESGTSRKS